MSGTIYLGRGVLIIDLPDHDERFDPDGRLGDLIGDFEISGTFELDEESSRGVEALMNTLAMREKKMTRIPYDYQQHNSKPRRR